MTPSTAASTEVHRQKENRRGKPWTDLFFSRHEVMPAPHRPDPQSWSDDTITVAWIGHATVLINFFGTMIITDPVFSKRAGIRVLGIFTLGVKRLVAPALSLDELSKIDLVLLSHAHMDHLDHPSLKKIRKDVPFVVAKNISDLLEHHRLENMQELDWNARVDVAGVTVEALRVDHFGWRFPWEKDRSRGFMDGRSYNAYLISKNGKHILFGGDTAYQEYFRKLAERSIPIELAIMAIGAYDPWIRVHATPEQVVEMANQMKAKWVMPVHWGTFIVSEEPAGEPIVRLKAAIGKHSPLLALEKIGETWRM